MPATEQTPSLRQGKGRLRLKKSAKMGAHQRGMKVKNISKSVAAALAVSMVTFAPIAISTSASAAPAANPVKWGHVQKEIKETIDVTTAVDLPSTNSGYTTVENSEGTGEVEFDGAAYYSDAQAEGTISRDFSIDATVTVSKDIKGNGKGNTKEGTNESVKGGLVEGTVVVVDAGNDGAGTIVSIDTE